MFNLFKKSEPEKGVGYTPKELAAFRNQKDTFNRDISVSLIATLERRLKDSRFAHKHEMYREKLKQLNKLKSGEL